MREGHRKFFGGERKGLRVAVCAIRMSIDGAVRQLFVGYLYACDKALCRAGGLQTHWEEGFPMWVAGAVRVGTGAAASSGAGRQAGRTTHRLCERAPNCIAKSFFLPRVYGTCVCGLHPSGRLLGRTCPPRGTTELAHLRAAVALFPGFVAGRHALAQVRHADTRHAWHVCHVGTPAHALESEKASAPDTNRSPIP